MKDYVLYQHTNKANGKIYIGITNDVKRRWRDGGVEYRPDKNDNQNGRPFWNAIKKFGWSGFTHTVLKSGMTFDEACQAEIKAIAETHSNDKHIGYNVAPGGNGGRVYKHHPRGMLGKHQSEFEIESHRKLMSDPSRNPMTDGAVVWGVTHPHPRGFAGHRRTQEEKDKISATIRARHISCRKMAVTHPDGRVAVFDSVNACFDSLGVASSIWYSVKHGDGVYHVSPQSRWKDEAHWAIDGCKLELLEE